eukprot:5773014-Prymnesium_polylepis.1
MYLLDKRVKANVRLAEGTLDRGLTHTCGAGEAHRGQLDLDLTLYALPRVVGRAWSSRPAACPWPKFSQFIRYLGPRAGSGTLPIFGRLSTDNCTVTIMTFQVLIDRPEATCPRTSPP